MANEFESDFPYRDRLRAELVAAARRQQQRRQRRNRWVKVAKVASPALLALVVVAVVTGWSVARPPSTEASVLSVQRSGGAVTIELQDLKEGAGAVKTALRHYGISAQVDTVPTSSSLAGHFVMFGPDNTDRIVPLDLGNGAFTQFRIMDSSRPIHLEFGRNAKPGETYKYEVNLFDRGGQLACSGLWGQKESVVSNSIEALFSSVRWELSGNAALAGQSEAPDGDPYVVDGYEVSSSQVVMVVAPVLDASEQVSRPPAGSC